MPAGDSSNRDKPTVGPDRGPAGEPSARSEGPVSAGRTYAVEVGADGADLDREQASDEEEAIAPGAARKKAGELTQEQRRLRKEDKKRARALAEKARAENTKRAYRADWEAFCEWCAERGHQPFPATNELIARYVSSVAEKYKPTTIRRKLSALNRIHSLHGAEKPASPSEGALQEVYAGLAREKAKAGEARKEKVAPLLPADLRHIVGRLPTGEDGQPTLRARRDKAILLVGFAGALRRSEIAAIRQRDVRFVPEGIRLTIPKSKTDQEGEGLTKAIFFGAESATCPVRALRSWLRASGITSGPVFRGIGRHGHIREGALAGYSIARIIKQRAETAGLNAEEFSGHSLRSGFITQAARNGAPERKIMRHSGHKDLRTVREYIHEGEIFGDDAPGRDIGL